MRVGYLLGMSLQTELIVVTVLGIIYTVFDASLLEFNANLDKIWDMKMDPTKFSDQVMVYMKYTLCGIVMVRTFTVHIYLGCYIVMLYPIVFEDRPGLLLPWIIINIVKCLMTSFVALLAGTYVCIVYKFAPASCWEFMLTYYLETAPSIYMLCLVMSFYKEMKKLMKLRKYMHPLELRARRHRVRMVSDSKMENHYREIFSRSLDGLLEKIKEDDESDCRSSNFERKVSFAPVDSYAENFGSTSSYQDRQTETSRLETNATCTQSFQIYGNVMNLLPNEELPKKPVRDFDGIGQVEQLERISNLDDSYKIATDYFQVEAQVAGTSYNTGSRLQADSSVSDALKLIPALSNNRRRSSMSKLGDLYPADLKRDSKAVLIPESQNYPDSLRTRMLDATIQVTSPTFEDVILGLVQLNNQAASGSNGVDDNAPKNSMTPAKRKSTLTEPSVVKKATSPLMPQMEGLGGSSSSARPASPPVKQIYKNRTAYQKTYRDDGYTQAFYRKIDRNKKKERKKDKDGN